MSPTPALIDEYLPDFDVVECHATVVRAAPARVWAALRATDFGRSPLIGGLLALRALPSVLATPSKTLRRIRDRRARTVTLDAFLDAGFALLDERPGRELLIGLEGRFWAPRGDLRGTDARRFRAPLAPGLARAAWDFRVEPVGDGRTRLSTETRVRCADAAALPVLLAARAPGQRADPPGHAGGHPARGGGAPIGPRSHRLAPGP